MDLVDVKISSYTLSVLREYGSVEPDVGDAIWKFVEHIYADFRQYDRRKTSKAIPLRDETKSLLLDNQPKRWSMDKFIAALIFRMKHCRCGIWEDANL